MVGSTIPLGYISYADGDLEPPQGHSLLSSDWVELRIGQAIVFEGQVQLKPKLEQSQTENGESHCKLRTVGSDLMCSRQTHMHCYELKSKRIAGVVVSLSTRD